MADLDDPRDNALNDLDKRITAALILCADTIEETRPHPDGRAHHDQCHHRHPDCLASRIRRTLTGGHLMDRPCTNQHPHTQHTRDEPGQPHDGAWCPGADAPTPEGSTVTEFKRMTTDHRPPPPSKPTAPPKPMPRPGGVADRIIRREWTAALRYAATVVLNPSESAALLNRADRIEAGELTPWRQTAPEPAPTSTESAQPAPAPTHGPPDAQAGSQGAVGDDWSRNWLIDCMLPHLPSASHDEPDLHDEAKRQIEALLADFSRLAAGIDRYDQGWAQTIEAHRRMEDTAQELATELADERTMHQQTIRERDTLAADIEHARHLLGGARDRALAARAATHQTADQGEHAPGGSSEGGPSSAYDGEWVAAIERAYGAGDADFLRQAAHDLRRELSAVAADLADTERAARAELAELRAQLERMRPVIDTAKVVAEHWRDEAMQRGWTPTHHALAMVLAALDGETDPTQLGIPDGHHDADRLAAVDRYDQEGN